MMISSLFLFVLLLLCHISRCFGICWHFGVLPSLILLYFVMSSFLLNMWRCCSIFYMSSLFICLFNYWRFVLYFVLFRTAVILWFLPIFIVSFVLISYFVHPWYFVLHFTKRVVLQFVISLCCCTAVRNILTVYCTW